MMIGSQGQSGCKVACLLATPVSVVVARMPFQPLVGTHNGWKQGSSIDDNDVQAVYVCDTQGLEDNV